MSRKSFDELVAEFQENQREKSPLEKTASAQWEQFKSLKNTNTIAAQQYIDSLFKSEYGFFSEDEFISLDNVKESTFFDANLHHEMQEREKARLKQEGESLLQEYCNDNNRDVTSSCAICDQSVLQCLCAFEMSPIEKEEIKYEWKAAKNAPILSSFLVLANENQKASLKYSIIGTCIHGKTDCCKLLYAQMNPERKATEKRDSKTGVLNLEFNLDPFTSDSGESATPYYVHYSQNKGILHQADETSSLILGANQIPEFTASGFIASFKRAFSLACTSKITNMPAVLYDIIVQECDEERYLSKNYVRTYLLPQYEVEFGLTLDFNGGVSFDKGVDFETSKGQSYSQLGLNIEGHLTEKIFSDKTLEYKAEVAVPQMVSAAKEHLSTTDGFVATFLKMLTLLEKVKVPMKSFSALPVTMGFIFPKIIIEGSYKLEYADPPREDDKAASKGSSLNQAQNIIQVKRENTKIEANPLLGGSLKLDILEMLASVLGPGAGKVIRQAMNYQGKSIYFKAKADLIAALTGGGYLEIDSSLANEAPKYDLKNLRANLSVELLAQIEAGIKSFVFSAAFTAGFKLKAKFELGFYTNSENEELGWYFGTNGAALYWTLIFSFGVGGDRGKDKDEDEIADKNYGIASLDASGLANSKKERWDESLVRQSDDELKQTQKYLQDLAVKKRSGLPRGFNYREGDQGASLRDIVKRQHQVSNLIVGKGKLALSIDELALLTEKYKQQGYLSSEDNSRRLVLKVEVEKIYKDYGVPTDIRGSLDSEQEYNLLEQRKKELDQIIKENSLDVEARRQYEDMVMGRTYKNPVAADVRKRRLEAEKELNNITDDEYQSTGKAVLIEASIFASDNLVSKDLESIKKEMYSRLEG